MDCGFDHWCGVLPLAVLEMGNPPCESHIPAAVHSVHTLLAYGAEHKMRGHLERVSLTSPSLLVFKDRVGYDAVSPSTALRPLAGCISVICFCFPGCSSLRGQECKDSVGTGVLPYGDLMSMPSLTLEEQGRMCLILHPDPKFISRERTSFTAWISGRVCPKSRMGRTLPGDIRVERGKHPGNL